MNLKKRAIALFLSLLLLGSFAMSAFAADEGDIRVTIGADLNADEIAKVYEIFGVDRGQVEAWNAARWRSSSSQTRMSAPISRVW